MRAADRVVVPRFTGAESFGLLQTCRLWALRDSTYLTGQPCLGRREQLGKAFHPGLNHPMGVFPSQLRQHGKDLIRTRRVTHPPLLA
jgi:hypothetical protein